VKKKKKTRKSGDRRGKLVVRCDDDGTVVAQKAQVLGILALVRSTNGIASMAFVNKAFNAAINIRRCAVLKTRPAELTRSKFVWQPLRLEVCRDKPKPIAGGRSKYAGRRLHVGVDTDTLSS
jgi:hypothetical protein